LLSYNSDSDAFIELPHLLKKSCFTATAAVEGTFITMTQHRHKANWFSHSEII